MIHVKGLGFNTNRWWLYILTTSFWHMEAQLLIVLSFLQNIARFGPTLLSNFFRNLYLPRFLFKWMVILNFYIRRCIISRMCTLLSCWIFLFIFFEQWILSVHHLLFNYWIITIITSRASRIFYFNHLRVHLIFYHGLSQKLRAAQIVRTIEVVSMLAIMIEFFKCLHWCNLSLLFEYGRIHESVPSS
jgi:hypothetical protein